MLRFYCLSCGYVNSVEESQAGGEMVCCHCHQKIPVPYMNDFNRLLPDEKTRRANSRFVKIRESTLVKYLGSHVVFSETSAFSMSFSLVLLLFMSPVLQGDVRSLLLSIVSDIQINSVKQIFAFLLIALVTLLMVIPPLVGIYLSLVHVFWKREKNELEKTCMFLFAIYFNVMVGTLCGYFLLLEAFMSKWWYLMMILPLWNWISGLLLLMKVDMQNEDDDLGEMISDEDASLVEAIVALLVCLVIVGIGQYGFGLHWSLTLSMCVAYATSFCESWKSVFAPEDEHRNQEDDSF